MMNNVKKWKSLEAGEKTPAHYLVVYCRALVLFIIVYSL